MSKDVINAVRISRQFIIFACGGAVSTLIDVSVMQLLVVLGVNYIAAVSVGFAAGLTVNYLFHERLTFKTGGSLATVVKYAIVVAINYVLTMLFVFASVQLLSSVLVGKIASLPVVAVNGFFLSKYWIFK